MKQKHYVITLISHSIKTLIVHILHLPYPEVGVVVWAPLKTLQPTCSIPTSLSSATLMGLPIFRPVHSWMLSSHLFLCLTLAFCPCAVSGEIVYASF